MEDENGELHMPPPEMVIDLPELRRPLHNQFNFNDRAAQTSYHTRRDRETMTQPPATATASGASVARLQCQHPKALRCHTAL